MFKIVLLEFKFLDLFKAAIILPDQEDRAWEQG